jgi:hypothetical protein
MRPQRKASWTTEDNERLKEMAAKGVPILRVAASLKCSMDAVRVQARKLGTPFPSVREARKKYAVAARARRAQSCLILAENIPAHDP